MNRGVYIADNLSFLRSLNDECIDLVCIDPPFAKNDTFTGDRIRPPLSAEEREIERRLLAGWGVTNAREAEAAGIVWPDGDLQGGYRDIWSWEGDIHEEWLTSIEEDYPAIHAMIEGTRLGTATVTRPIYATCIRLLEIHRALSQGGSYSCIATQLPGRTCTNCWISYSAQIITLIKSFGNAPVRIMTPSGSGPSQTTFCSTPRTNRSGYGIPYMFHTIRPTCRAITDTRMSGEDTGSTR